jgi:uncharacterized coiled-coil protein SlyX
MRRPLASSLLLLAVSFCLAVCSSTSAQTLLPSPPTEWTPFALAVWVVGIIVSLLGGGFLTKVYLQRTGFLNEREKASWIRLKTQLDDQAETIAQQDDRLNRQRDDLDAHYQKTRQLQEEMLAVRLDAGRTIAELQRGIYEEREANKSIHEMFDQMCEKVKACEARDAAKAEEIQQLTEHVTELSTRVEELSKAKG